MTLDWLIALWLIFEIFVVVLGLLCVWEE